MAYIDDRIAELEQRIAEKKAYQRMNSPHKYASTWDYVAEGDRSGFDRMDAEEAAYRNMLAQQAQQNAILKAQQEFTAKENELNRKNTMDIAKMNKANELESKKDEYIRSRNKAASILDYAQQALAQDPNNIQLQKEVKLAKEDFDYYDRKLGGEGYDKINVQTEQQSGGLNNKQVNDIVNAILDNPSYTNEERNKLLVLKEYVDDPVIKERIDTVLSKKGATKEDKVSERLKKLQSLIDSGKNLNTKQRDEYNRLKSGK